MLPGLFSETRRAMPSGRSVDDESRLERQAFCGAGIKPISQPSRNSFPNPPHLDREPPADRQLVPLHVLLAMANKFPPSPPYGPGSVSPPPTNSEAAEYSCQWGSCTKEFQEPELLYSHLCNDHVGRKSTNNLCLTCDWANCGTHCVKRDHITSHLRGESPCQAMSYQKVGLEYP